MALQLSKQRFPCPVCCMALDAREDKKKKLYVVCDSCGIQMFVRMPEGIRKFIELINKAQKHDIWAQVALMEAHYRKQCPDCGKKFWIHESEAKTSWVDGEFEGYKCTDKKCEGIARKEKEK